MDISDKKRTGNNDNYMKGRSEVGTYLEEIKHIEKIDTTNTDDKKNKKINDDSLKKKLIRTNILTIV